MKYVAHVKVNYMDSVQPTYTLKFGNSLKELLVQIKKISGFSLAWEKPESMTIYKTKNGSRVTTMRLNAKDFEYGVGYKDIEITRIY